MLEPMKREGRPCLYYHRRGCRKPVESDRRIAFAKGKNTLGTLHFRLASGRSPAMSDHERSHDTAEQFCYGGKVTRRRLIGYGAGALGATMLMPSQWQAAFGQAKPYKIGTLQPLSGAGASGGKTALVGVQMAVDRINKSGGINGRPVELIVAD